MTHTYSRGCFKLIFRKCPLTYTLFARTHTHTRMLDVYHDCAPSRAFHTIERYLPPSFVIFLSLYFPFLFSICFLFLSYQFPFFYLQLCFFELFYLQVFSLQYPIIFFIFFLFSYFFCATLFVFVVTFGGCGI